MQWDNRLKADFLDASEANQTTAARASAAFGTASEFKEEAFAGFAGDNTHLESATSLKSKINGKLSLKAAFTTTLDSRVPPGTEMIDTITLITLVFDFGA